MSLLTISKEFFESGNDNYQKKRYNAATDSYFKAIVTLCDYELSSKQGLRPKNHTERFTFLEINYPEVYQTVSSLFERYRKTYHQQADEHDAHYTKEKFIELTHSFNVENHFA